MIGSSRHRTVVWVVAFVALSGLVTCVTGMFLQMSTVSGFLLISQFLIDDHVFSELNKHFIMNGRGESGNSLLY